MPKPTYNKKLPFLPGTPAGWKGNPLGKNGRYRNLDHPFDSDWWMVFKLMFLRNPKKELKKQETWRHTVVDEWQQENDGIFWLGHASFLIQWAGVRLLIDPVLFKLPMLERYSELPFPAEQLVDIDYILLTHDHRDHCDERSIRFLAEQNPQATFLGGLEMHKVLKPWLSGQTVQEAGWYQSFELEPSDLQIAFLPTRHWSRRYIWDLNQRLWGAFLIQCGDHTFYFGGDSAYAGHFLNLPEQAPTIDLAFLGIGAYDPRWYMKYSHMSPTDAYQAFVDSQAQRMIGVHYGTFDLSWELLQDPQLELQSIWAEHEDQPLETPALGSRIWVE